MNLFLKILGGIAVVGAGVAGGLAAGPAGAVAGGITALVSYLSGLHQPSPAAAKAFGTGAK